MEECIFCRIAKHEIPAEIVYEDEELVAFKDVNPAAPVHILVIPKRHVPAVMSVTDGDRELIGNIFLVIQRLVQEMSVAEDGFRVVVNQGRQAGQSVPHLHFHLLGGRSMSWPPG